MPYFWWSCIFFFIDWHEIIKILFEVVRFYQKRDICSVIWVFMFTQNQITLLSRNFKEIAYAHYYWYLIICASATCALWFDSIFVWDFHVYTWGMIDIDMGMWPQISLWRKEEISRTKNLSYQVVCQPITDILIMCNNTPYTRIDVIPLVCIHLISDEISFRQVLFFPQWI